MSAHRRVVRVFAALWVFGLCICFSAAAVPWPPVYEETYRVRTVSPDPPLNGPIALSGDTLLASSILRDDSSPTFESRFVVFVFERNRTTGNWQKVAVLTRFSVVADWPHELHLALEGNTAVVATFEHAQVFERSVSGWSRTANLQPPSEIDYGSGAAIAGDYILLGGQSSARMVGLLYERNGSSWALHQVLPGGVAHPQGFIGPGIDLSRDIAVIGHDGLFDPSGPPAASAYLRQSDGTWALDGRVPVWDPVFQVQDTTIVGAAREWPVIGPQIHPRSGGAWTQRGRIPLTLPMSSIDMSPTTAAPGEKLTAIGIEGHPFVKTGGGFVMVYSRRTDGMNEFRPVALLFDRSRTIGAAVAVDRRRVAALSGLGESVSIFDLPHPFPDNPPIVQDDFQDGDYSGWLTSTSSWVVHRPRRSLEFLQPAVSGDRRAIRNGIDWTNQSIEADIRIAAFGSSTKDRGAGLIVRHRDNANYYYALLNPRSRSIEVYKRVQGREQRLFSTLVDIATDRTYRVRLEAIGTRIGAYVDGAGMGQVIDDALDRGAPGLRTILARANYDNVVMSANPQIALTTAYVEELPQPWAFEPNDDHWSFVSDPSYLLRREVASELALGILGYDYDHEPDRPVLADHIVHARVRPLSLAHETSWVGVAARIRDRENYISLSVSRSGEVRLRKVERGVSTILARASRPPQPNAWHVLRLEAVGSHLRGYVNGVAMVEATDDSAPDPTHARSRYGVVARRATAEFDSFRAATP